MKQIFAAAIAATLLVSGLAVAQDRDFDLNADYQASPSDLQTQTAQPQVWLPTEEGTRESEARKGVRRKAEFRADQRMRRIAARQWTGNSAARPRVAATSLMAPNTTSWGGNLHAPFAWFMTR